MILTCSDCGTRVQADGATGTRTGAVRCRVCGVPIVAAPVAGGDGESCVVVAAEPGPFRQRLCDTLQGYGCQVKTTADGEQALEWVRKIRPQTVFANVFLRRMLGITLAERVRDTGDLDTTRLILIGRPMGGQGDDGAAADLEALYGAAGYLEEDLDAATLSTRTAALLGRSEPAPVQPTAPEPEESAIDPGRTQVLPALGALPETDEGAGESLTEPESAPSDEVEMEVAPADAEPVPMEPEPDQPESQIEMEAGEPFGIDPEPAEPDEEGDFIPPVDPETTEEIERLGRIAADDLYLYYPAEVATALQSDHVESTFRQDLAAGRHLVQARFPGVSGAVDIFLHALMEKLRRTAIGA